MPVKAKPQANVWLTFLRDSISYMPERLRAHAATQASNEAAVRLEAAAKVLDGWLSAPGKSVRCERPIESWLWLEKAARECKAFTFATLIASKVSAAQLASENMREKRDFDERTKAAMQEYLQGGGD